MRYLQPFLMIWTNDLLSSSPAIHLLKVPSGLGSSTLSGSLTKRYGDIIFLTFEFISLFLIEIFKRGNTSCVIISLPFLTSFDVADDFEIGHSFESDTIEILGSIVPDNVGGGSR